MEVEDSAKSCERISDAGELGAGACCISIGLQRMKNQLSENHIFGF
jgi:hypothetical protein